MDGGETCQLILQHDIVDCNSSELFKRVVINCVGAKLLKLLTTSAASIWL